MLTKTDFRSRIAVRPSSIRVIDYAAEYRAEVLEGAREMHRNSVYHDMPMDEAKVIRQLSACLTTVVPDRYFRIAVRGDKVLGGFYGIVRRTFFCDEVNAHDMGWWVKESYKGSATAVLLLMDFERWSKSMGARKIMIGQSTERDVERTTKLYQHCGFRVIGYNTVKDL